MLIGGMDVSGDLKIGNHKFMAIVIGTKESIDSIIHRIGFKQIHMSNINKKAKKNQIISKLRFNNDMCIAFCIRIDRDIIVNDVNKMKKIRNKRIPKKRIWRTYNHILWKQLEKRTTLFLNKHNQRLQKVVFQCDQDCAGLAQDNHVSIGNPEHAHTLCDIIAWANNRGREPQGVISIDWTDVIRKELVKKIA